MSNCQHYLELHLPRIKEAIRITKEDDHEHAFAFNEVNSTEVMLGNCNDVQRPTMPDMVGTVHVHTIDYTKFSDQDIETFSRSPDKIMCVALPKEGIWQARCIDRSMAVCGTIDLENM
jgi:hypothetical protein